MWVTTSPEDLGRRDWAHIDMGRRTSVKKINNCFTGEIFLCYKLDYTTRYNRAVANGKL